MYKTVLMRNAPYIPLWGVVSKHPTEVECRRPMAEVLDFLPEHINSRCQVTETTTGSLITCTHQEDVSNVIECMRAMTCKIRPQVPTLVATPAEKLAGIEHFYGTNALGALPTCSVHTHNAKRDLHCLSQVDDDGHSHLRSGTMLLASRSSQRRSRG